MEENELEGRQKKRASGVQGIGKQHKMKEWRRPKVSPHGGKRWLRNERVIETTPPNNNKEISVGIGDTGKKIRQPGRGPGRSIATINSLFGGNNRNKLEDAGRSDDPASKPIKQNSGRKGWVGRLPFQVGRGVSMASKRL